MRRHSGRVLPGRHVLARALAACSWSLSLSACGGPGDDAPADPAYGDESLVVGDWLMEAGLLVLSRPGGRPELRAAGDPSLVVWKRRDVLPAIETAGAIGAQSLLAHVLGPEHRVLGLVRSGTDR